MERILTAMEMRFFETLRLCLVTGEILINDERTGYIYDYEDLRLDWNGPCIQITIRNHEDDGA